MPLAGGDAAIFPDISLLISIPAMLDPWRKDPVPEPPWHFKAIKKDKIPYCREAQNRGHIVSHPYLHLLEVSSSMDDFDSAKK
jgi:hypothetical protein